MRIPFAEWRPDVADLDTQFAGTAHNVLPGSRSYRPLPAFAPLSTALPDVPIGASPFLKTDGSVVNFAGTGVGLYRYGTGAWTAVTRGVGGAYTAGEEDSWQFAQFGDLAIATDFRDVVQAFTLTGGTNFAALGGTPPKAKYIAVVGDFVVLGNLDANRQQGIQWSGLNNAAFWTPGTQSSDIQLFPDGGAVMGLAGGTTGYVFQQTAIRRMLYRPGSPVVFQFDVIEPAQGLTAARSLVQVGKRIFYYSNNGFFMFDGQSSTPIGSERVDRTFATEADATRLTFMVGAADPRNQLVIWLYVSKTNGTNIPDKALIYNWSIDRWTTASLSGSLITSVVTESLSLEGLNPFGTLETLPFSLDSRVWLGGATILGLFGTDNKLAFASGTPMAATIETAEVQLTPEARTFVSGASPIVDTAAVKVAVSGRERQANPAVYGAAAALEDTGECTLHNSSRFHQFMTSIDAGANWTHALGIDVAAQPDGVR